MALSNESAIAVTVASGAFLPANAKRQALLLSSPTTNPVTISKAATAVANTGLVLKAGSGPVLVLGREMEDWIQNALTAISVGGSETIACIEISLP